MRGRRVMTALALALAVGRASAGPVPDVFWSATSAGFHVDWSADDLSARSADGVPVFSARTAAGIDAGRSGACRLSVTVRPRSLIGPYLGYEEASESSCPGWAHPAGETRLRTVDLRRAAATAFVSLTDVFPARDVAAALRHDPLVRKSDTGALPAGLADLITELAANAEAPSGMCFIVPADLATQFVLLDGSAGRARVRVGLPGAGPCRMALTELGLTLKPSPALAVALGQAQPAKPGERHEPPAGRLTRMSSTFDEAP